MGKVKYQLHRVEWDVGLMMQPAYSNNYFIKKSYITFLLVLCTTSLLWSQKPNIVFILADDLGWGDLASYGHPYAKTPNLDRLAGEGTQFMRFYVSGNTCNPSRTGFMTSRHPNSYANNTIQHGFQDRISITEILQKAGYQVGHFGKWHIGPEESNGTYGIHDIKIMGSPVDDPAGRDMNIYKEAANFIEVNKEQPFYVNVWGHATHFAVDPAASLANIFKDVIVDRSLFGENMQGRFEDAENLGGNIDVGMRNYLGDVYGLDSAVGFLVNKIDELGLKEKTIVVFSSDQGPAPVNIEKHLTDPLSWNMLGWAGKMKGSKHNNWEGGVRAPFIIRWPGLVPEGKVNHTSLFSGMDWLPTLGAITGVSLNDKMFEGEDVSDIWKGSSRSRENPLFWKWAGFTVVQDNWKLTYQNGKAELFDLSTDIEELVDVSAVYPDITAKLDNLINQWKASIPDGVNHDKNVVLTDPVKEAVVIGPADIQENSVGIGNKSNSNSISELKILSNPILKSITLYHDNSKRDIVEFQAFDFKGQLIFSKQILNKSISIDTETWSTGIYHIQVRTGETTIEKRVTIH